MRNLYDKFIWLFHFVYSTKVTHDCVNQNQRERKSMKKDFRMCHFYKKYHVVFNNVTRHSKRCVLMTKYLSQYVSSNQR